MIIKQRRVAKNMTMSINNFLMEHPMRSKIPIARDPLTPRVFRTLPAPIRSRTDAVTVAHSVLLMNSYDSSDQT